MTDTHSVIPFEPPDVELTRRLTALPRAYFRPSIEGLEHLDPEQPTLLVGNHTLLGLLDAPLMIQAIYERRGIFVRALGDRLHFTIPPWKRLIERFGVVLGNRESCAELMRSKQHVLVFPGGGREVAKRRGEAYELIWKERVGFARMAIEHGYTITPFAAVGAEECYDIVLDADDVLESRFGAWVREGPLAGLLRKGEVLPPLVKGWGGTPLPKPQRFYFAIGEPMSTAGRSLERESVLELRDQVRARVYDMIDRLRERRSLTERHSAGGEPAGESPA